MGRGVEQRVFPAAPRRGSRGVFGFSPASFANQLRFDFVSQSLSLGLLRGNWIWKVNFTYVPLCPKI